MAAQGRTADRHLLAQAQARAVVQLPRMAERAVHRATLPVVLRERRAALARLEQIAKAQHPDRAAAAARASIPARQVARVETVERPVAEVAAAVPAPAEPAEPVVMAHAAKSG